ncbi:hypothetical protein HCH54_006265 [Aspergillus fumigatus]
MKKSHGHTGCLRISRFSAASKSLQLFSARTALKKHMGSIPIYRFANHYCTWSVTIVTSTLSRVVHQKDSSHSTLPSPYISSWSLLAFLHFPKKRPQHLEPCYHRLPSIILSPNISTRRRFNYGPYGARGSLQAIGHY